MASITDRLRYLLTGKTRPDPAAREQMRDQLTRQMRSKIDAAATTDENRKHWSNADSLSADSAYDASVRFRLRNRSRYEGINNCYAKGAIRSSADDLVGTGPRLQLSIPGDDGTAAKIVERHFAAWADETKLAIKLRTAQKSRVRDGECFGLFDTNERLRDPVKFDTRWVEAELCTTPFTLGTDPNTVDGIKFDRLGNPLEYYFLSAHPGNLIATGLQPLKFYTLPSERVLHWFSLERFGQHRAIPELTPALPLYSQVRRYTLATLTAAEFAAMLAGVMKTNVAPEDGGVTKVDDWSLFELVRGALLTLPDGWDASQFRAEQPTTTYGDFKKEILNESGRATNQPLNVVTGNSSGYNFSSGRLDHLPYHRGLAIERNDMRMIVLDPIFRDGWYPEAVLVGQVPRGLPPIAEWKWSWHWDGFDSIDQNKDATADDTRIRNGTQTYSETFAAYGQDWQEQFDQIAREKAYAESKGLPWPVLAPTAAPATPVDPAKSGGMEEIVRAALVKGGLPAAKTAAILDALAPTFAELRQPRRNGQHGAVRGGVA